MSQHDRRAETNGESTGEAGTAERVEARVENATDRLQSAFPLSRRQTLVSLASVGGLSAISESADAQPSGGNGKGRGGTRPWRSDVDAGGHELFNLGALGMANNPDRITDFAGDNLQIDGSGTLYVSQGAGSGLDADTLDGLHRQALEQRISELEAMVEENRTFVEGIAATINSALSQVETYVNDDLATVENSINDAIEAAESDLNAVGNLVGEIFTVWVEEFEPVFDYLSDSVDGLEGQLNVLIQVLVGTLNQVIGVIDTNLDGMARDVENTVDDLSDHLQDVDSVVNSGLNAIESDVNGITSSIESDFNSVVNWLNNNFPVNLPTLGIPDLDLPVLDLSSISVDLPDFSIGTINPRISIDIPSVSLPSLDVPEFSLPRVSIPTLSLPRVDEEVNP